MSVNSPSKENIHKKEHKIGYIKDSISGTSWCLTLLNIALNSAPKSLEKG